MGRTQRLHELQRRILEALAAGAMPAGQLGGRLDVRASRLSYHLAALMYRELITYEPQGIYRIYSLTERGRRAMRALPDDPRPDASPTVV